MNLKQLYQWVGTTRKQCSGVTRHFRETVRVFSPAVVRSQSSQLRKLAGAAGGKADSQRRRLQRFVSRDQPLEHFFPGWTRSVVGTLKQRQVVLVVAYGWMLLLGATLAALGRTTPSQRRTDGTSVRRWSLFREGCQAFLAPTPPV